MPHVGTDPDGGWCCNTLPDAIADVGLNALADQFAISATRIFSASAIVSMLASGASAAGAAKGGDRDFSELKIGVPVGNLGGKTQGTDGGSGQGMDSETSIAFILGAGFDGVKNAGQLSVREINRQAAINRSLNQLNGSPFPRV